ncbi:MAG: hypothetical protein JNK26_04735, partial [Candidatus Doudnabacteria bacterium]|nr:hypothetical protein [Candidatus Doudnabacteria bacterium]
MSAVSGYDTTAARENYRSLTNSINTIFLKAPREIQCFIFEYSLEHHTDYFEVDHLYLLLSGIVRRWRDFPEIEGLDEKLRSLGVDIVNHGRLKRGSDQPMFGSWKSISSQILVDLGKLEILDANMDELIALKDRVLMDAQINRIINKHDDANKGDSRVIDPVVSNFFKSLNSNLNHYLKLELSMDYVMQGGLFEMVILLFNKLADRDNDLGWCRGICDMAYEKVLVPLEKMIDQGGLGSAESVEKVIELMVVLIRCSQIVFEGRETPLLRKLVASVGALGEEGRGALMGSSEMEGLLLSSKLQARFTRDQLSDIWGEEVMSQFLLDILNRKFQKMKKRHPNNFEFAALRLIPDVYSVFPADIFSVRVSETGFEFVGDNENSLRDSILSALENGGASSDSIRERVVNLISKLRMMPDLGRQRTQLIGLFDLIIEELNRKEREISKPFIDEQHKFIEELQRQLAKYHDLANEYPEELKTAVLKIVKEHTNLYVKDKAVIDRVVGAFVRVLDKENVALEDMTIMLSDLKFPQMKGYYLEWVLRRPSSYVKGFIDKPSV